MESLPAFLGSLRHSVRSSFVAGSLSHFQLRRRLATWGKPLPPENEPSSKAGRKTVPPPPLGCGLGPAKDETAGCLRVQPREIRRSGKEIPRRNEPWRNRHAAVEPSHEEELRNLRNDDFPQLKAGSRQPRPPPVERTRGCEVLFGAAPCSLALARAKRSFGRLFLKARRNSPPPAVEGFARRAAELGIPVQQVHRKVLDALCKGGVHQGVCLEATALHPTDWRERPAPEAEETAAYRGSQLLWLALEGIQDPMNLGAVLRSAHFLGVHGIVMSQRNSCSLTPVVSKASSGALEVLDVFSTGDLPGLLQEKSDQGWEVLGTAGPAKAQGDPPLVSCLDFRWTRPTILLLGNEGVGLSPETRRWCQKMLTISPGRELPPGIESLNVSVAAGILLHAICSQKVTAL
ncbi:rRNA methyltransferase 1, mitochondrial-like isoform X2 [Hemicordylus capensis]|nr:rRNA methyltransferase 1, mitochondrial-like isoform X2 [Hemicordylus capensis]XP_053131566.1 rRNA methyltransferase 1, mitochondrial-like isoform X2 [Hemicordylus capensis]XP_053131567.1 rRNA methyltransferase 1, mitochondrial-like isoform X2 [Hemicordylus capensis]